MRPWWSRLCYQNSKALNSLFLLWNIDSISDRFLNSKCLWCILLLLEPPQSHPLFDEHLPLLTQATCLANINIFDDLLEGFFALHSTKQLPYISMISRQKTITIRIIVWIKKSNMYKIHSTWISNDSLAWTCQSYKVERFFTTKQKKTSISYM
jgi:hypothetical protein